MKNIKKIFSFQNITILLLVVLVIMLVFIAMSAKKNKMQTVSVTSYEFDNNRVYCQERFLYNEDDTYELSLCENKLYIIINAGEFTEIEVNNVKDIFHYYTAEGQMFYALTANGDVYELTFDKIINGDYTMEKLDLESIINIKDFYSGIDKENAYNYGIYAIDTKGALHLIK